MRTLLALALFALGCGTTPIPDPPPGPTPAGSCTTVCENGAKLGCHWAEPTPNGKTCVVVCEDAQTAIPWDLTCMTSATSCEGIDACQTR